MVMRWNHVTQRMETVDIEEYPSMYGSGYTYKPYVPSYPFDGIDRHKWPTTWVTLVRMYFSSDWHSITNWRTEKGAPKSEMTKFPSHSLYED